MHKLRTHARPCSTSKNNRYLVVNCQCVVCSSASYEHSADHRGEEQCLTSLCAVAHFALPQLCCIYFTPATMIGHLVKASLCLRLLPASAAVSPTAGRGFQRATYYHQNHRRSVAFGWTLRGGGSAGDPPRSATTAAAAAGTAKDHEPQELSNAPASLLATVKAVASDVDGTLTTPEVTVTERTKQAIKAVMDSGLTFFPATGKVRCKQLRVA